MVAPTHSLSPVAVAVGAVLTVTVAEAVVFAEVFTREKLSRYKIVEGSVQA